MARIKEGAFIEIAVTNEKFYNGRILGKEGYGSYNIHSESKIFNIDFIKVNKVHLL